MTEYKHEYQKFADSAVRARLQEEGFGRLRLSLFLAAAGPLAIFLTHVLHFAITQKWMAIAILGTAPLAIVLLIVNYIRLPNESKASPQAIMTLFLTLIGAAATIVLAKVMDPALMNIISPPEQFP
jgi:hypothetical protein